MADIRKLINQIADREQQLRYTQFIAPCVRGGRLRTSVGGIVYTFAPQPRDFEGWGIFEPSDEKTARLIEEPSLPQVAEYLQLLKPLRLRLAYVLKRRTWLAYPVNESDMQQRLGAAKPVPVHLVTEAVAFEPIIARWDGGCWWFDELDRRAEPLVADRLREQMQQLTATESLQFKGITPEMRTVYHLATYKAKEFESQRQQQRDEKRLRQALKQGGGELQEFRDRDDHWLVEWTTADGDRHTCAIAKNDLTVVSSGICLSGRDRDFDLQSLVGVMEGRDN
ncbi:MAG: hypothetical protein KME17_24170 [Cyanosarcina radialis HA8281-LM2]|jgi:hypothetical protein|nr:hypothetical protein [Cyanosarcina radialis HA8281-LM2]